MKDYNPAFFSALNSRWSRSADVIVPLIFDLIKPRSVIDVGCGTGSWLAAIKAHQVDDVLGVDGEWVPEKSLRIPKSCFMAHDLKKPIRIKRRFDLAISLEVAEHLDKECARGFVDSLVRLSSVVVFSAAIPYQGGTHHVNEQWPDYWAELFEEHGYVAIDCFREKIWNNVEVDWFYAQNMFLFADRQELEINPKLQQAFERTKKAQLSLVHPKKYLELNVAPEGVSLKYVLGLLPGLLLNALSRRIGRQVTLARK
jgi:SAM-dependent methyltransferase